MNAKRINLQEAIQRHKAALEADTNEIRDLLKRVDAARAKVDVAHVAGTLPLAKEPGAGPS